MADKTAKPKHSFSSLGGRVRALREERGMTQAQFGAMIGISGRYVGGVERGERNLCYTVLTKIAYGCDISLSEFFEGVDDSRKIIYGSIQMPDEHRPNKLGKDN